MKVEFLSRDAPWNAGDVVEFPGPVAEKLIRNGVAKPAQDGRSAHDNALPGPESDGPRPKVRRGGRG